LRGLLFGLTGRLKAAAIAARALDLNTSRRAEWLVLYAGRHSPLCRAGIGPSPRHVTGARLPWRARRSLRRPPASQACRRSSESASGKALWTNWLIASEVCLLAAGFVARIGGDAGMSVRPL
jgi:hypothetical protein